MASPITSSLPSSSTTSTLPSWETPRSLLESLLLSEKKMQSLRETIMKKTDASLWAKNHLVNRKKLVFLFYLNFFHCLMITIFHIS